MTSSLTITTIVLTCLFSGAMAGMGLRALLPKHHLAAESADVIKLAMGLMATVVALVLSLLISSANTTHNTVESEYRQSLANVGLLDRYLADYGPETQEARGFLRQALVHKFQAVWPLENFGPVQPVLAEAGIAIEGMERRLFQLSPDTDAQKWFRAQALEATTSLAQVRWLLLGQETGSTLPMPLVFVLVSWSTALFIGFGLFTRPNVTVIVSLFVSALAVSGAIFLIVELDSPFAGIITISSAPAHALLGLLGK